MTIIMQEMPMTQGGRVAAVTMAAYEALDCWKNKKIIFIVVLRAEYASDPRRRFLREDEEFS